VGRHRLPDLALPLQATASNAPPLSPCQGHQLRLDRLPVLPVQPPRQLLPLLPAAIRPFHAAGRFSALPAAFHSAHFARTAPQIPVSRCQYPSPSPQSRQKD